MKQFTIELDESVCKWLEHLSEVTGEPVERLISNGIFNHVAVLDDIVSKAFLYNEN